MPAAMRATVMRTAIAIPALAPLAMGFDRRDVSVGLRTGAGGDALGRMVLEYKVVESAGAVNVDWETVSLVSMLSVLNTLVDSTSDILVSRSVEEAADDDAATLDVMDVTTTT